MVATIEGEIEGRCFTGRRRTARIDDVRRWTGDDMNVARTMQWKEDTTAGSRISTGRSAYGIRTSSSSSSSSVFIMTTDKTQMKLQCSVKSLCRLTY